MRDVGDKSRSKVLAQKQTQLIWVTKVLQLKCSLFAIALKVWL